MAQDDNQTMSDAPPRPGEAGPPSAVSRLTQKSLEALLGLALAGLKAGHLDDLLSQRPRFARWLARHPLRPVLGVLESDPGLQEVPARALTVFLRWGVANLRPDRLAADAPIDRVSWLERTSWRPMLAVACHYGLLEVPDFPDRYRRRADESPADNLCGLWAIGPSTFYRYVDKGKRLLAAGALARPLSGRERHGLRQAAEHEVAALLATPAGAERRAWHHARAQAALADGDCASALWHLHRGGDVEGVVDLVHRFEIELAGDVETDVVLDRLRADAAGTREQFHLFLAQAALWNSRNVADRARQAYERALHLAHVADDKILLGIVHGALGKFHELRDTDKARACLEDSAEYLRQGYEAATPAQRAHVGGEYVAALQKLAWIYVLRSDPRTKAVLERAQELRATQAESVHTAAMIEQTWGEYWRRSGDLALAIEHKLRALNLFERLGDRRQVLSTYNNLSIIYGEARDFDRAIQYARSVLAFGEHAPLDPYIGSSTRLNLGVAYFWKGDFDAAIHQYRLGLALSEQARLVVTSNRARYNLAEAYYKKFQQSADPRDEAQGDAFADLVRNAPPAERDPWMQEAAPRLKREVLGPAEGHYHERLLAEDKVDHFPEMAEVRRHRTLLALPSPPRDHVRAHLAIAQAYLAISTKEREAALALIRQHELQGEFDAEFDALQITFSRELTKEKVLQALWKHKSYGVLTEERATTVLRQVLDAGSINKSGYAQLCLVGLATASKHLGTLAERGLLVQMGKGPSTRYVLPMG